MNDYMVYPLIILIMVGAFSQLYYATEIDFSVSNETITQELTGNQTLDETESELQIEQGTFTLDFNMTVGLIIIIVGAIALGLIGLNVLGSGLSDNSYKTIWNGIVYYGMWGGFSIFGYNAVISLPLFGVFLWFILTLVYTFGVFSKMGN